MKMSAKEFLKEKGLNENVYTDEAHGFTIPVHELLREFSEQVLDEAVKRLDRRKVNQRQETEEVDRLRNVMNIAIESDKLFILALKNEL